MNYNYLSVNLYFMKFILSFHHKSNHLIEYFSLWCHLYLYLILIVMSFNVPNINIRYIWHHHEKSNHHFLCRILSRLTSFLFEWFKFNTYLWFGDWNANHWQKKNVWSLVKKVEMTSVNGFKNIILNENTEGIPVFIEINLCWYIVVSIAIKHFQ